MAQAAKSRFRIGIDTGGTFTDIVALDTGTGTSRSAGISISIPRSRRARRASN
jgi:N-methylhydantoinase A/oxoprolinase/acetone carboxylase beta subunit